MLQFVLVLVLNGTPVTTEHFLSFSACQARANEVLYAHALAPVSFRLAAGCGIRFVKHA